MQVILKSWIKHGITVAIFKIAINLIYLILPLSMMLVYDRVLFSFSEATLFTLVVVILFSLAMMGLVIYFQHRMLMQLGNKLAQKVMPFVLETMHRNAAKLDRQGYSRGIRDVERLRNAIVQGRIFSVLDLPWILIYLGILFFIHPLVGGVATAAVFLVAFSQMLLLVFAKKRYTIADVAFQSSSEVICTSLAEAELVTSMGMLSPLRQRYLDDYDKILTIRAEADVFHSAIDAGFRFLVPMAVAAVFAAGAFTFFANEISTGAIFAIVLITARLLAPFDHHLLNMQATIEAIASFKRLHRHVNLGHEHQKLALPRLEGKVAAESLSLALNGKALLHNISFLLEPGESLGIIGPSSVGKTSLCKILLGIWPATTGKIRLDGAEVAQWPEEELRLSVGYMPQDSALFPATVAENIARLQHPDPEKVVAAAQKAGVHETILSLPHGYSTRVDHAGKNLSAGQRQFIALARALYGDPRFVVLDEPHTHLDDVGLNFVLQAIRSLKQENITTVMVTDRTHLLANMDKLLVIREGQMALFGPAQDVLKQLVNRPQQPQQAA